MVPGADLTEMNLLRWPAGVGVGLNESRMRATGLGSARIKSGSAWDKSKEATLLRSPHAAS
jgi:hypothetical protein